MTAITKSTIFSAAWKNFFDLLTAQLANPHTTGKWIFAAFPDENIASESAYPILVIDNTSTSQDAITYGKVTNSIRIPVTLYTTSASQLDTIMDEILYDVDNNITTLRTAGLRCKRVIGGPPVTMFPRAGMRVHMRTLTFQFDYFHTR